MASLDKVKQWLEADQQIGKTILLVKDGNNYWFSVGVQKWQGLYKVYFDKVRDSEIDYLDNEAEQIIEVENFESLAGIVETKTPIKLEELTPLKGQRIFNPAF